MRSNLAPETVLLILIQRNGLLFRRTDFIQLGYSKRQYNYACRKLQAHRLIKRLGKGQYISTEIRLITAAEPQTSLKFGLGR
jgi:hypothetical protein